MKTPNQLKIEIKMDSAAFKTPDGSQSEPARILEHLARVILNGNMGMTVGATCPLRDLNGNTVGKATVSE